MTDREKQEPEDIPFASVEPMRQWEKLVLEHHELLKDSENDTSARRREINQELQEMHARYRRENPQFFHGFDRECDDEFDR